MANTILQPIPPIGQFQILALRLHPLPQLPQQRTLLPPLPLLHQLLLQLALRPHPPPQQRALLPLAGIFVAAAVYIYMVGAQKPLAGIFVAAAVVLYMVGAQKPPEIGNTRINTIIHDKVIISSYHHIFVVVDFLYISNNMSRYHPMRCPVEFCIKM